MIRRYFTHFIIYIIEVLLYTALAFTLIEYIRNNTFFNWTSSIFTYDFAEKATALFLTYQILVFAVLTLKDSSRRDAILANIKVIKLAIVRIEHGIDFSKDLELAYKNYFDKTVLFNDKDKEFIQHLYDNYNSFINEQMDGNLYYFYLKNELVNLEHEYEMHSLEWRLSFILRQVK